MKKPKNMKDKDTKDVNMACEADNSADIEANDADELALLKDDYLRLQAEFDNYRKRTLREKLELAAAGGEDVIRALLPVLDDSDRALAAMGESSDREGVELIYKKMRDALAARGLSEIEATGNDLDTDLHEAVAQIPAPDEASKGKVIDVVQKGYKLHGKVLRHAKCVVGE